MKPLPLMLLVVGCSAVLHGSPARAEDDWNVFRVGYVPSDDASQNAERLAFEARVEPLERNANWGDVIAAGQEEQKNHPDNPGGPFAEAMGLYYRGDIEGAVALWDKTSDMAPAFAPKIDSAKAQAKLIRNNFPTLKFQPLMLVWGEDTRSQNEYSAKSRALLQSKKFDAIESGARALIAGGTDVAGNDFLDSYLDGLAAPDNELPVRQAQIAAWRRARPQSNLARLAAIKMWVSLAWQKRGTGYANSVTAQMQAEEDAALEHAGQGLQALPVSAFNWPVAFEITLEYGLLSGLPRPQMDDIAASGLKRFPTFQGIRWFGNVYRLAKWYGAPGETEAFVEARANKLGGEAGDIFYARQVASLLSQYTNTWQDSTFSYERFQRGLRALNARRPGTLWIRNAALHAAVQKRDYAVVKAYFSAPNGHILDWRWNRNQFPLYISQWRVEGLASDASPARTIP